MNTQSVGIFIAEQRKKNKLTQQELAEKLSVTNKAVSKWENGDCFPDITLMPKIAEIFYCTVDDILKHPDIGAKQNKVNPPDKMFLYDVIAVSLLFIAVLLFFTLTYSVYLEMLGFGVMSMFIIAANIISYLGLIKARCSSLCILKKQVKLIIYGSILIIFMALPYLIFDDKRFVNSVLAFGNYLFFLPFFLLIALSICQLALPLFVYATAKRLGIDSAKPKINFVVLITLPFLGFIYYKAVLLVHEIVNNTNLGTKDASILTGMIIGAIGVIIATAAKKKLAFEDWIFLCTLLSSCLLLVSAKITLLGNFDNDYHRNLRITMRLFYPAIITILTGIAALRKKLTLPSFLKILCACIAFILSSECYILSNNKTLYLFYPQYTFQFFVIAIVILINIIQRLYAKKETKD